MRIISRPAPNEASIQVTDMQPRVSPAIAALRPMTPCTYVGRKALTAIIVEPVPKMPNIGERDDAVAPQPKRHHRLRGAALLHGKSGERGDAQSHQRRKIAAVEAARLHQRQHRRADADDQQDGAEIIDTVPAALDPLGQEDREHRDAGGADRQIDPEHHRPMHVLDQKSAERRPDDRRDAEHAR